MYFSKVDFIAYLEYKAEGNNDIENHIDPDENVHSIMKRIAPARHEQSDILQQNGGFDED